MTIVNIYEAKTQLSRLLEQTAAGDDAMIARSGKPVARLTRFSPPKRKLKFGVLKRKIKIATDFRALLPDDVLGKFVGS